MRAPCFYAVYLVLALVAVEGSSSLEELVRTGVLTPEQAARILSETTSASEDSDYSILGFVSGSTLIAVMGSGAMGVAFVLTMAWAVARSSTTSLCCSVLFGILFYGAGLSLVSQGSGFLASLLLIMAYVAWMSCVFSLLAGLGLTSLSELDQGAHMRMHAAQVWISVGLGYAVARSCSFVLTQVPFFLSIYVAADMIGESRWLAVSNQPTVKNVFLTSSGVFLLIYTYFVGPSAFLSLFQPSASSTDFQVMSYITGSILLWHGFTELSDEISMKEIKKWQKTTVFWMRTVIPVGLLLFGFRISSSAVVFMSMKWMADELANVSAAECLFPGALVVAPLLYLFLISNYSLQLINDIFAPQARQYLSDSYLWSLVCYFLTVATSFSALLFALKVSDVKVQVISGDERQEVVKILWGRAIYKFVLCYTLTLLLILLAEYESSWLVSFSYLVFSVITYGKVLGLLLVSDFNDPVLVVMFLSGQRITLVGAAFWTCFLLGAVLMGLSLVLLSLRAKESRLIYLLSLVLLGALFATAIVIQSCLLFAGSLVISLQVWSTRLRSKEMTVVVGTFVALLAIYLAEEWDFNAILNSFGRSSVIRRAANALSDPSVLVPEREAVRRLLEGVRDWLLDLSFAPKLDFAKEG